MTPFKMLALIRHNARCEKRVALAWISWAMLAMGPLRGDPVAVDLRTEPMDVPRLFWGLDNPRPVPIGSTVWLVADRAGDGLFADAHVNRLEIKRILSGESDNVLVFSGLTDGTLLDDQRGKVLFQGIPIESSQWLQADFYFLLWRDSNSNFVVGDLGDRFGLFKLGRIQSPAIGNKKFFIHQDVYADQYSVNDESPVLLSAFSDDITLQPMDGDDAPATTYSDWRQQYFDQRGLLALHEIWADPDADGLANGLEFLLGCDPLVRNSGTFVVSIDSDQKGSEFTLKLPVRTDRQGVRLIVKYSPDLTHWTSFIGPSQRETLDETTERWIYRIPTRASSGYIRLLFHIDSNVR